MNSNDKTQIEDKTRIENTKDYQNTSTTLNLKTFRNYKILQELPATGGESDNYIIDYNGKKAFLKLYRKGLHPNVELLRKLKEFSQEHKEHVVEIYDVGDDEDTGRYYEIMEYVQYGNLREFIKEIQTYNETQKYKTIDKIILEIAEALKALHDEKVIHRDLKPSNIIIRNKNNLDLVLIDFGIARDIKDDVSKIATTSFKGTRQYISPEEISGYFGKEIDWWHLGIIVYELLNEKNPFEGLNDSVILNTLTIKNIELPKEIPEKYKILLKGLLTKDYEKRWGYEQVRRWLNGDTNIPVYYDQTFTSKNEIEKEWDRYGIPKDSNWKKLGLSPSETETFIDAEFGFNDAKRWVGIGWTSGVLAKKWYEAGFEPEEAYIFESLGFGIRQAIKFKEIGLTAYDFSPLMEVMKENPELVNLDEIYKFIIGIKLNSNKNTLKTILSNYKILKKFNVSLKEAYSWVNRGIDLDEFIN